MSGVSNEIISDVPPSQTHDTHLPLLASLPHQTGFLSLPVEIRRQIFTCLTPQNQNINSQYPTYAPDRYLTGVRPKPSNSILLLNHQTSAEALDNLYGSNTFKLEFHDKAESHLREKFSKFNLQRVKKITFVAGASGAAFGREQLPDEKFWEGILPGLSHLRFVLLQAASVNINS